MLLLCLCALYALCVVWFARSSLRGGFAAQLGLKTTCGMLFVAIACVCFLKNPHSVGYFYAVAGALVCSLAGDVLIQLMRLPGKNPRKALIGGGLAFFGAHCLYGAAFMRLAPPIPADLLVFCGLYVGMLLLLRVLRLDFGGMKLPCLLYMAALLAMLTKGLSVWYAGQGAGALTAAGGALFVCSDTLLALKGFRPAYRHNALVSVSVTGLYYMAQLLLALSILYV